MNLLGRVRGPVSYSNYRNTPFQLLAADGAKLALIDLWAAGFDVRIFVHDEFVIAIPDDDQQRDNVERIEKICIESMREVVGELPVKCEYSISGGDAIGIQDCVNAFGRTRIATGSGVDGLFLGGSYNDRLTVNMGADNDVLAVKATAGGGGTRLALGGGND